jgi:hypothetical protein
MLTALFWFFVAGVFNGLLLWARERLKETDANKPLP